MQSKDIKVGRAYAYSWRRPRYGSVGPGDQILERVVVKSAPKNGQVEIKMARRGPTATESVANLVCLWTEHEEALREQQALRDEAIASMKAARAQIERLLPERFFDDGERPDAEYDETPGSLSYKFEAEVESDGSYSTEDRLTIHELADMLQAAYDKGQQDAKAKR